MAAPGVDMRTWLLSYALVASPLDIQRIPSATDLSEFGVGGTEGELDFAPSHEGDEAGRHAPAKPEIQSESDMEAFKIPFKPVHPAPERMRSPTILAFVQKTISQKIVVTPKLQFSKR
jgi:hypothetical protein